MNVDFKYNVISRGAKKGGGRGLKNDDGQFLAWKSAIIFYSKERGGGKFSIIDYSGVIFFSKNWGRANI